MTPGHFSFECKAPPKAPTPNHLKAFAFGSHYMLKRFSNGKVMAKFMGVQNETKPRQIWVPKSLMPKLPSDPSAKWKPMPKVAPILKWVPKSQA